MLVVDGIGAITAAATERAGVGERFVDGLAVDYPPHQELRLGELANELVRGASAEGGAGARRGGLRGPAVARGYGAVGARRCCMSGTSVAREYEAIEPALAAARNQGGTRCCMSGTSVAREYGAVGALAAA